MARKKLESDTKRSRSYIRLNKYEKDLVEIKAKKYGYKSAAAYLRDVGIHENVYVEELEGKQEILNKSNELIELIINYRREQKELLLRSCLTPADIIQIKNQNTKIVEGLDLLQKRTVECLKTNVSYVKSRTQAVQACLPIEEG